jgi:hypothetical protein
VLQNGVEHTFIPWDDVAAVFVGGDDAFKYSEIAMRAARTAKMLGKWVHVGRVNTAKRVRNWIGLADSIDGSGMSRYDHMLEAGTAAAKDIRITTVARIAAAASIRRTTWSAISAKGKAAGRAPPRVRGRNLK